MLNTLQEQWTRLEAEALQGVSDVQKSEMKKAFYTGAAAVLNMQWDMAGRDQSEAGAIQMLEGWHQECRQFFRVDIHG